METGKHIGLIEHRLKEYRAAWEKINKIRSMLKDLEKDSPTIKVGWNNQPCHKETAKDILRIQLVRAKREHDKLKVEFEKGIKDDG